MKNRYLCVAMAAFCAIGMISCGNPAKPEIFLVTQDNVDEYVLSIGEYEGLSVEASKETVTDEMIEFYADHYYEDLANANPDMLDSSKNPIPMTDEAIKLLNSDVYATVSEFMVFVRESVEKFADYEYENKVANQVLKKAAAASDFSELPEMLLNNQKELIATRFSEAAKENGLNLEQYLTICGTSLDELATDYAREELVLYKIAKDIGIEETDENIVKEQVFSYIVSVTDVK